MKPPATSLCEWKLQCCDFRKTEVGSKVGDETRRPSDFSDRERIEDLHIHSQPMVEWNVELLTLHERNLALNIASNNGSCIFRRSGRCWMFFHHLIWLQRSRLHWLYHPALYEDVLISSNCFTLQVNEHGLLTVLTVVSSFPRAKKIFHLAKS